MTNYSRGANHERDLMRHMREQGYKAYRTAGSHSPVDVIAGKRGHPTLALQLKSGRRRWPSRDERIALDLECSATGWEPRIVFREPRKPFEFVPPESWPPA